MTLFYVIFILALSIKCLISIFDHSKDKTSLSTSSINLKKLGNVDFKKTGFLMYSLILGS
jgi:hypothetical protein